VHTKMLQLSVGSIDRLAETGNQKSSQSDKN
jgi:hypothetical protein